MLLYIVTYDICCQRRRQKVADVLEAYGRRVQYSVFECLLEPKKYQELKHKLARYVDLPEDSLRFYPLSAHTSNQVEIWGKLPLIAPPGSIIV
jgi:CRISPR-associated protein Cas2